MHPELMPKAPIQHLLHEVVHRMVHANDKDLGHSRLFSHDVQRLHGCGVGYMIPEEFKALCKKYKLDDATCELMFLQTGRRSVPHVPLKSGSAFMPLGPKHGYTSSRGAMYRGKYHPRDTAHELARVPTPSGEMICTFPGDIFFFTPEAPLFSALMFVTPKMRQDNGDYNMLYFPDALVSVGEKQATVIL